jgi:Ca2+-transporting ATPase
MRRAFPAERLTGLVASGRGLAAGEVRARRERYGPNDILEVSGSRWRELVRDTARDPMIWFLVATGAVYGVLGDRIEAAVLLASIVPLAGMDAFLHRRTRASTEGLRTRLATRARVVRDGAEREVPAEEVLPGDLAIVAAGEAFPADGLVEDGAELQADESALTGEAYPVRKQALGETPRGAEPAVDARYWGFAGTRLLTGRAAVRVVFTGRETIYGEIVRLAMSGTRARTPLQVALGSLVALLLAAATVLCLILAVVRLQQGFGWADALVSAMTLAVAALPEEFPVVFTAFLGVGVYRLAKRKALVRRAVSVENIGRLTCICADKTGTITEGQLALTHLVPVADGSEARLLAAAALATRPDGGDPLDQAIARAAEGTGESRERLAVFPFTEERRRETAIAVGAEGRLVAATKGSPEIVLAMCALAGGERDAWRARIDALAAEGHKVIACATRAFDADAWAGGEPDRGLRLEGLLAFEDPVREGVAAAIAECAEAEIRPLVVTGDHPATAYAVAREIGLGGGEPVVVTAEAIEAALARGDARPLRDVDVVARAIPSQKLALVRALQAAGEVVAVTGDGVNDVPALQAADIGIAMGERGTRSAREIAAIVLLDDNFATIVHAVAEGRQLFRNLRLSFAYLIAIHIPFVVSAALVPLAGYPLLYLPIHVVWLELVIHPTALLVFQELPPGGRLGAGARRPAGTFFTRAEWATLLLVGGLLTVLTVLGYVRSLGAAGDVEHARAMALVLLTGASAALTAVLSGLRTRIARLVAGATVALAVVLVQVPPLAARLHVRPLHLDDWALALGASAAACLPLAVGRRRRRAKGGG